ncbi:MAG: cohesin domain-containing protein, partial [candidate division Zixibacteria bacterium]|nr:cohesin domain-containing protein [candidate division Zixibacteria bacterium]
MFTHLKTIALSRSSSKTTRCLQSASFLLFIACWLVTLTVTAAPAAEPDTPFAFEIQHDVSAPYWSPLIVGITKTEGPEDMFGFDLLVDYDASVLRLNDVIPGEIFNDTGLYQWEYFQWRIDSSTSPRQTIRIVAIADMNNGSHHPLATAVPDGTTLFNFSFTALPQGYTPIVFTPLRFRWQDCGDNMVVANAGGDSVAVSLAVNEWTGSQFVDITDPNAAFPTDFGTPNVCLDTAAGPPVNRFVNYFDGAVTTVLPDEIDNRGDINLNCVAYEIADYVMFENYFIVGESAFGNLPSSIQASDVNADGLPLRLEDLVFLERVICGDTLPLPVKKDGRQAVDSAIITQDAVSRIVSVEHPDILAGLFLIFQGEIAPTFLFDTAGIMAWSEFDGSVTRVMIIPNLMPDGCRHGFVSGPLFAYVGNGLLIEQENPTYADVFDYPQAADFGDNHFHHNPIRIIGTDGRVDVVPDPLSAALARVSDAETIALYMGDFDAHTAGDVDLMTLRINDSMVPLSTAILPSYPGFTGEVLTATVGARDFILSLDMLMAPGVKNFAVTATYADDQTFVVPGMLTLVSENAAIGVPSGWPTIQAAIDAAIDGDAVQVAGGTYTGDGNRDLEFNGRQILVTS